MYFEMNFVLENYKIFNFIFYYCLFIEKQIIKLLISINLLSIYNIVRIIKIKLVSNFTSTIHLLDYFYY